MKASINVEFTDEELVKYAADAGRRVGLSFIHDVMRHIKGIPPGFVESLVQTFSQAAEGTKAKIDPEPTGGPVPPEPGCRRVIANQWNEEGWWCCGCMTYNNLLRATCRACGHGRCDIVVPPPPAPNEDSFAS